MAIKNYTKSQERANEMFRKENSIFLTGKPGTGKTELIEDYRERQEALGKKVLVTASTGLAATNLTGGRTLHSALRWNPKVKNFDYNKCSVALRDSDILIIDEASMLNASIIDHLYYCLQYVNRRPQIIICGDFFQLPPVTPKGYSIQYPFEVETWKKLELKPCVLYDVVRQKDPEYKNMLEKAMLGDGTCIPYFNENTQTNLIDGAIILCTKNNYANYYNQTTLSNLPGCAKIYYAQGEIDKADFLHSRVEKCLTLKKNMRVMALRNAPSGDYQNGSLGTVIDMAEDSIKVKFDSGSISDIYRNTYEIEMQMKSAETDMINISQFPLLGGYAITIHKSQGQTFDSINIKAPSCWEPGQLYVALSRARDIKGIHLMEQIRKENLFADIKVIEYYENLYKGYAA